MGSPAHKRRGPDHLDESADGLSHRPEPIIRFNLPQRCVGQTDPGAPTRTTYLSPWSLATSGPLSKQKTYSTASCCLMLNFSMRLRRVARVMPKSLAA